MRQFFFFRVFDDLGLVIYTWRGLHLDIMFEQFLMTCDWESHFGWGGSCKASLNTSLRPFSDFSRSYRCEKRTHSFQL